MYQVRRRAAAGSSAARRLGIRVPTGRTVFGCLLVLAQANGLSLLDDALREGWTSLGELAWRVREHAVGDLVFPAARLVVELDGRAFHATADRFARDRERQNRLGIPG